MATVVQRTALVGRRMIVISFLGLLVVIGAGILITRTLESDGRMVPEQSSVEAGVFNSGLTLADDYATRHSTETQAVGVAPNLSYKDDFATRHPSGILAAGAAPELSLKDDYGTRHMSAGRTNTWLTSQDDYGTRHLGQQP